MTMITSFLFFVHTYIFFLLPTINIYFYNLYTNLGIGGEKSKFLVFKEKWKSEITLENQSFNISIPIILGVVDDFYFH